jgi:hypothetical protein
MFGCSLCALLDVWFFALCFAGCLVVRFVLCWMFGCSLCALLDVWLFALCFVGCLVVRFVLCWMFGCSHLNGRGPRGKSLCITVDISHCCFPLTAEDRDADGMEKE